MRECFAITTYCNSDEKVKILNNTIDNLKQFNIDIIIHAHYPLNVDTQKKVNLYYYSSDNPILPRYNIYWHTIGEYNLEFKSYDISYTVMKQWKEIINIMSKYDVIHFLNYDINISPELYKLTERNIQLNNKSIFYESFIVPNEIQVVYFSILNKDFDHFSSFLDKDKFLSLPYTNKFCPSIEDYVKSFLDTNFEIIHFSDYQIYVEDFLSNEINITQIDGNMKYLKLENGYFEAQVKYLQLSIKDGYSIFVGYYDDELSAIVFDLKKELKIEIDNNKFNLSKNCEYFIFKIINRFKINDELISEDLIDGFINLESKITK